MCGRAVLPKGLSGDLGRSSGNLEVWVNWRGTASLVGVPSAVPALSGDSEGHGHMVTSECPQSTCRHPSAGLNKSCSGDTSSGHLPVLSPRPGGTRVLTHP